MLNISVLKLRCRFSVAFLSRPSTNLSCFSDVKTSLLVHGVGKLVQATLSSTHEAVEMPHFLAGHCEMCHVVPLFSNALFHGD